MARSNVRRLRPTEARAVLRMLEDDHDDVEELAKNIVRMLNRMRAAEPTFVRVVRHGTGYLMYGPYASASDARSDDLSNGPAKAVDPDDIRVYSLIPPFNQPMQELDDLERGQE